MQNSPFFSKKKKNLHFTILKKSLYNFEGFLLMQLGALKPFKKNCTSGGLGLKLALGSPLKLL